MKIISATFVKGVVGTDEIFEDGKPQIVFIGRSNAGKSSVINALVNRKKLALVSSFPGRTQQINIFLINTSFYLVDLPGYGYAKIPKEAREQIQKMIHWYLFKSEYAHKKIVLVIDANVGMTDSDKEMLHSLQAHGKNVVIVANKIDKIKKSVYDEKIQKIKIVGGGYPVIPFSAEKKIGAGELSEEITSF